MPKNLYEVRRQNVPKELTGQQKVDIVVSPEASIKFKDRVKENLIKHEQLFWEMMSRLHPKDFCDTYLKLLPYGFAKVPEEKPLDDSEKQRLILEETTRRATIIGAGLPEDADYEE